MGSDDLVGRNPKTLQLDGGKWKGEYGAFVHALTPRTRRDLFAAAALAGMLARGERLSFGEISVDARAYADSLIYELDKSQGETE